MLSMVTPRSADLRVTHAPAPITIEELNAELARQGLPPMGEIFRLDYQGSATPDDDVTEAELVASESPPSVSK